MERSMLYVNSGNKMSKHIYTTPACIVAGIDMEQHLLQTSRNSETGNKETSTNKDKPHYNDPTVSITGRDGGESLAKDNSWLLPEWDD